MMNDYFFSNRFKNKIALITGGASGLGKAIAYRLGQEGAILTLLDNNKNQLNTTIETFQSEDISAKGYLVDITEEDQVRNTIDNIVRSYGKLDVVINSAGIVGPTNTPIIDFSKEDFKRVCQINLLGSFLVTKYAVKKMCEQEYGRILLISSIAGKEGNPGMVGYSASKAGVIGIVKSVAKEYATQGITVNGLAPAVIKTSMNEDTSPEQLAYMTEKIPMERIGTTEEVAAMSCFIVSEENSFSTGFIFDISGGRATY